MPTLRLLPRTILRPLRPSPALTSCRPYSSTFQPGPSPPRLPAEQQAEFERLQRAVSDRIADPTPLPHEVQQQQQQPSPSPASTSRHTSTPAAAAVENTKSVEELPTSVRRGAKPEFEGDTNPKTGRWAGPRMSR